MCGINRIILLAATACLTASCITPRGRSCLGFLEKCGETTRCVHYLERTGLEATCEIPCTSDANCGPADRCLLTREDEFGPINICIKKLLQP